MVEELSSLDGNTDPHKERETQSIVELMQDLQHAMTNFTSAGKRIVIVLDAVNKVEENVKTHLVRKYFLSISNAGIINQWF